MILSAASGIAKHGSARSCAYCLRLVSLGGSNRKSSCTQSECKQELRGTARFAWWLCSEIKNQMKNGDNERQHHTQRLSALSLSHLNQLTRQWIHERLREREKRKECREIMSELLKVHQLACTYYLRLRNENGNGLNGDGGRICNDYFKPCKGRYRANPQLH